MENELLDKVVKVGMSALQSQLYKQAKIYKIIADGKGTKGCVTSHPFMREILTASRRNRNSNGGGKGLSNELMQLRKICQHPFLFESVEDRICPTGRVDDSSIWRSAGKFELLTRILPKQFSTGHRISSVVSS